MLIVIIIISSSSIKWVFKSGVLTNDVGLFYWECSERYEVSYRLVPVVWEEL